mmetsp:Transcript_23180/g.59137  ORF Transcript_23180/g.59137 Transcript_23180/m.59137 type:complete len:416 (+) Transcript_23180:64-1311(+)
MPASPHPPSPPPQLGAARPSEGTGSAACASLVANMALVASQRCGVFAHQAFAQAPELPRRLPVKCHRWLPRARHAATHVGRAPAVMEGGLHVVEKTAARDGERLCGGDMENALGAMVDRPHHRRAHAQVEEAKQLDRDPCWWEVRHHRVVNRLLLRRGRRALCHEVRHHSVRIHGVGNNPFDTDRVPQPALQLVREDQGCHFSIRICLLRLAPAGPLDGPAPPLGLVVVPAILVHIVDDGVASPVLVLARVLGGCLHHDGAHTQTLCDGRGQAKPPFEPAVTEPTAPAMRWANIAVTACHVHDTRGAAAAQRREEQVCEKEVAKVVGLERDLYAVLGHVARHAGARIVHQHVQRPDLVEVLLRERAHGGESVQVQRQHHRGLDAIVVIALAPLAQRPLDLLQGLPCLCTFGIAAP